MQTDNGIAITGTTQTLVSRADGLYLKNATAGTTNSAATIIGNKQNAAGGGPFNFATLFDVSFLLYTGSNIAALRLWVGLQGAGPGAGTDTTSGNSVTFRYSTVAGDGGWVGVTNDGTQAVTGTVAAIAASTFYTLRIWCTAVGTVNFSVNGGTTVSTSTHVPTNDNGQPAVMAVYTNENVVKFFELKRMFHTTGS